MGMYVPPQYGQGGGGGDNLVQLAMAVKSFKMKEKEQKRSEAAERVQMLMSNPQLLMMQDPKEMEKDLKTLGIKVTDQAPANPQDAAKSAPPAQGGTPVSGGGGGTDPNALAALASATGGSKSGAQSASPASAGAGSKSPGGGVTSGIMPPQMVESMAAKASERLKQNYGALAPIYMGAQTQLDAARHQAQLQGEIDTLKEGAAGGDIRSMARLSALAGHQVTDSDIRGWVVAGGASDQIVSQAMDVALHNETGDSKALRFQNMSKDLMSNTELMSRLTNPLDVYKITSSLVYGGAMPDGVQMKPFSLNELKEEADYEKTLMTEQGLPYGFAHLVARGRSLGIPPTMSLPPGMQGLLTRETMGERKIGAQETTARAAMVSALADKQKADDAHTKINQVLANKEYDSLNERVRLMIEADKAKHPWPDEIKQGYLNQLARATGLMPEEVDHWYKFGMTTEYKQDPASDLAKAAAGRGPRPAVKPTKKEPTLAERGGVIGAIARNLPRDKEGKVESDPMKLYMEMDEATRGKALKYLRDILVGIEPAPEPKPAGGGGA
jgi:hypothetical protein